jgi:predicted esterase
MASITNAARRALWRLLFGGAITAGVGLAFCARYLAAPRALGEPNTGEAMNQSSDAGGHSATPEEASKEAAQAARLGRLLARPATVNETAQSGLIRLGLGQLRDGLVYVPASYEASRPAPLVLSLHGAGGNAQQGIGLLQAEADRRGFIVLAVESRRATWDLLMGGYGPDVEFLNRALARTFGLYAVDPQRVAVAGFSDGASYALSLGLTNGDVFGSIIAFSPGFMAPETQRGQPRIYISHGDRDSVLPIDRCSRRIVPQLQRGGYAVRYHEFDGPHTVPSEIKAEAASWWLARGVG